MSASLSQSATRQSKFKLRSSHQLKEELNEEMKLICWQNLSKKFYLPNVKKTALIQGKKACKAYSE
jgi:hypothetical protein